MDSPLRLAHCTRCDNYSFPAGVPGCRYCGGGPQELTPVPCPQPPRLVNWVTVRAELAPGLPVPCVIGEVELAPGVIEEALLDLGHIPPQSGMPLVASHADGAAVIFRPAEVHQ